MSLPRFGVTKPVPVNLLMAAFLIAGLYCAFTLQREFFPETRPDSAQVTLPYPGATPEEVEEALAIKVEDRLWELEEVKQLTTTIAEGGGGIIVEFHDTVRDVYRATDEVQRAIDQIEDLPDEVERIRVTEFEPALHTIMVTLYGEADEEVMKRAIRRVRDDLISLPDMGEIAIGGARDYEVRVDLRTDAMIEHGLSVTEVRDAIRNWMTEVPGGVVRTDMGNINIRALGVEERSDLIEQIVIRGDTEGAALRVRDVAAVQEYFVDEEIIRRYNGQPAVSLTVYKVGDQDIVAMAEMVRAYVMGLRGEPFEARGFERIFGSKQKQAYELGATARAMHPPPPGTQIETHSDLARFVEDRLRLLLSNAMYGAILVFMTLLIFLNWRVALWVGVGITTALAGALVFMEVMNITLNLLTMFGLIVVLGLLVDDAIVVAENIQARHDRGEPSLTAAVKGAEQVAWPVAATVLTTIVAFLPLAFVRGQIGDLLRAMPFVVACALIMSLIESLLILPSHMGHSLAHRDRKRKDGAKVSLVQRYERWRDRIILNRIVPGYGRALGACLNRRYLSLTTAVAVVVISAGMVAGGRLGFTFLTEEDSETIIVDVRMPIGTPSSRTTEIVQRFEDAAVAQEETLSVSTNIGQLANIDTGQTESAAPHVGQIFIELYPVELRERESALVTQSIRELVGPVEEAERIRFSEITGGPGGPDITIRVRGDDIDRITTGVERIKAELRRFDGVFDITDDSTLGQREVQVTLKPGARSLGFSQFDIATQLRGAVFGLDAHVFAADQEDIDVRIRLDETTRRSIYDIENLWLITPPGNPDGAGRPVPLQEIAELVEGTGYATINRVDRKRAVTVTADTAPGLSPEEIMRDVDLDAIRAEFPMLTIETAGRQQQMADAFGSLPLGFLAALVGIYVILAWLFSSYVQPILIMLAIPFGIIGVVWGHLLLGFDLTFLSAIGFVALSGVVVNDSLILLRFYNTQREGGAAIRDALIAAGMRRFRPIFLTTITTVLGLTPLMLEQSFQARFLIPMAIAIAFGLMGATMVILIVLPCLVMIADDVKRVAYYLWHGVPRPQQRHSLPVAPEPVTE